MTAPADATDKRNFKRADSAAWHARASAARLAAVQSLYEIEMTGAAVDEIVIEHICKRWSRSHYEIEHEAMTEPEPALFKSVVMGTAAQIEQLDTIIASVMEREQGVSRLDHVLRAILRAAVFELSQKTETPARVVFDEYVELAKAFYQGREPDLVNGVLDRLGRVLRPNEMGEPQGGRTTE